MATTELKEFLARTPFFGGLVDASMDRLVDMLTPRELAAGSVVFREGDKGCSMYVVESGELLVCRCGSSGLQVRLTRLGQGDFFGETTLIEMQPRPVTVKAVTDARLYELSNLSLYKLYQQDVKAYVLVLQNVNRELARRLRKAETRLIEVADQHSDDSTQIKAFPTRPPR